MANGKLPEYTTWGVGGNVKLGSVKAFAAYYDAKLDSLFVARPLSQTDKVLALGLYWDASVQVHFTATYYHDKGENLNNVAARNGNKDTLVLAGFYSFSKRTELYGALFSNRFTEATCSRTPTPRC